MNGTGIGGTGTVTIGTGGTFSTGTGATTIDANGNINLTAGTFNANGNITATGGAFTQTGGTFTLAPSQTMTVQSGGSVSLGGSQTLYTIPTLSLTGGTTTLTAGSTAKILVTGSLSITSPAQLDLQSNDMIVHNGTLGTVTTAGSITNEIAQGRGTNGLWTGAGITSSSAALTPSLTALGVELNNNGSGGTFFTTFEGQPVTNTDVLVKFTFVGDADLSGTVGASDYLLIDSAFNYNSNPANAAHLETGWRNGDFNYDGHINGDDYTLIDNAYNTQGSTTYAATPADPAEMIATDTAQIASVPEPASSALLCLSSLAWMRRRRRMSMS